MPIKMRRFNCADSTSLPIAAIREGSQVMQAVLYMLIALKFASLPALGQATTVFAGIPTVKISEGGVERLQEDLDRRSAANLECVISKIGEDYYWASRHNVPLLRVESGAFITFIALTGAGHIRVVDPGMKGAVSLLGEAHEKFDYVEHLLIGLSSVTYYGNATRVAEWVR